MIYAVLVLAGLVVNVVTGTATGAAASAANAQFSWTPLQPDVSKRHEEWELTCLRPERNRKLYKNKPAWVLAAFPTDLPTANEKCQTDMRKFAAELTAGSSWATEMFDASAKVPNGLVHGNRYHLGNYDQCIGVSSPENSVRGKYCLAKTELSPRRNTHAVVAPRNRTYDELRLDYDVYGSVFEKLKMGKHFANKTNSFDSGLCIPDSCRAKDAEALLSAILGSVFDDLSYDLKITVPDSHCSVREDKPLPTEAKVLGCVILGFIFWVLFCTVLGHVTALRKDARGKLHPYLEAFSLSENISKFAESKPGGDMNIFNGMKFLSMCLIIMGHRGMASLGGPFLNPRFLEERYRKMQNILLLNGTLIVDTFFLIGGYLTFLTLFKECKRRKLNFLEIYAYRWLRIVPVYMLVIFFYAYLLEHADTGPLWAVKVGREAERCRKNWWTNFFFVNNYVNTDSLCMFQSWYITCDMHFTLVAPFVVQLIVKSPKKGLILLALLIVGSVLVTFVIVHQYKYDGVLRVCITTFEDLASSFTFNRVYIRTHHRGTPYFSGMAAAYLYLKLKEAGYRFTKKYVWMYSILAAVSGLAAICGAWIFYIPGRRYNALENAFYAAVHRLLWSFSMSWIALAGGTKALGILEPFLSNGIFTPFSKLSYSTFLVHGAIQLYTTSTLRVPEHMDFAKLYWMTCGDVILSFAVAFLLHIFFEAPIKSIQGIIFSRKTVKR